MAPTTMRRSVEASRASLRSRDGAGGGQLSRPPSRSSSAASTVPQARALPDQQFVRYLRRERSHGENSQLPSQIVLDRSPILIGRDSACTVVLDDEESKKMVSRQHIKLEFVNLEAGIGKWRITDCDSLNGVLVNWVRIRSAWLQEGDMIIIGSAGTVKVGESKNEVNSALTFQFEAVQKSQSSIRSGRAGQSSSRGLLSAREHSMDQLAASNPPGSGSKRKELETLDGNIGRKRTATGKGILEQPKSNPEAESSLDLAAAAASTSAVASVGEEVTCPVCQCMLVGATSLQCSHMFCEDCIQKWLVQHSCCPVCRRAINSMEQPTRVRAVDAVVSKLAPMLPADEQTLLRERQIDLDKRLAAARKAACDLKDKIRKAGQGKFLNIGDPWTEAQRKNFVRGTNFYRGEAREVYCEAAGFTRSFIEDASLKQLLNACGNLSLNLEKILAKTRQDTEKGRMEQKQRLRRALWLLWCWNSKSDVKS